LSKQYNSVGGGFVMEENGEPPASARVTVPFPFASAPDLLQICRERQIPMSEIVLQNELVHRSLPEIHEKLDAIWRACRTAFVVAASGLKDGSCRELRKAAIP